MVIYLIKQIKKKDKNKNISLKYKRKYFFFQDHLISLLLIFK